MLKQWGLYLLLICLVSAVSIPVQAAPLVVFDEGHDQRFLPGNTDQLDLSGLAGLFKSVGYQVAVSAEPIDAALLNEADVLVISGAFQPLTAAEIEALHEFLQGGGGLAVMLHVAPPLKDLLHSLEVDFTNGTLREMNNIIGDSPLNFSVFDLAPHPLTEGLESFAVYGAWALRGTAEQAKIVARTSTHGWVDLDHNNQLSLGDAAQPFGVIVAGEIGKGKFAVFGDDALFQNRFFDENNQRLAMNLAKWLAPAANQ